MVTENISAENPSSLQQRNRSTVAGEFDVKMERAGDDNGPKNDKRISESSSEHDAVAPKIA